MNPKATLAVILVLTTAGGWSCDGDNDTDDTGPVTITGAMQKGPLIQGSTLTVGMLDSGGAPTGANYNTTTTSDLGDFTVTAQNTGPAELVGEGYYFNEIKNALSGAPITLRALYQVVESGEQNAYLNSFTHMSSGLAMSRLASGNPVEDAVAYAENKLFDALGILHPLGALQANGTAMDLMGADSPDNQYVMAVSCIVAKAAELLAVNEAEVDAKLQMLMNDIRSQIQNSETITPAYQQYLREAESVMDPMEECVQNLSEYLYNKTGTEHDLPDPNTCADMDDDGIPNAADPDIDGDGVPNEDDADQYDPAVGFPGILVLVSGDGQSAPVGTILAEPIVVRVEDAFGNPVPGIAIDFEAGAAGGTQGSASPEETMTDANGEASTSFELGTLSGADAQWLEVTTPGWLDVDALTVYENPAPGDPASIEAVNGDGQKAAFGQQLQLPLVVHVGPDQHGNTVTEFDVAWSSSTGGTLSDDLTPIDGSGNAATLATLGPSPGSATQVFTATAGDVSVLFHATATEQWIDYILPGRAWAGCPIELEVEIVGGGFDSSAEIIWDEGGIEQALTPVSVDPDLIVVVLPTSLLSEVGTVPVAVSQSNSEHCTASDFYIGGVLPDTGQLLCYDGSGAMACPAEGEVLSGQDAQHGWDLWVTSAERFTITEQVTDQPVVSDHITRLEWQGCAAGLSGTGCGTGTAVTSNQQTAMEYCESLDWGGCTDWRLPNVVDLSSIIHAGESTPSIEGVGFPGTLSDWFWSSSDVAFEEQYGWLVDFATGAIGLNEDFSSKYLRCVRGDGGPSNPERFERFSVGDDRIVIDAQIGLMWQGCSAGQSGADCSGSATATTWQEALDYCAGLSWGGHGDWRLPDRNELQSIVDYDSYDPAIDVVAFPSTPSSFWSSSTEAGTPNFAWVVDFDSGFVAGEDKSDMGPLAYTRCARAGIQP